MNEGTLERLCNKLKRERLQMRERPQSTAKLLVQEEPKRTVLIKLKAFDRPT